MADTRYPVRRDGADMLSHPDQGLNEQERQQEIADRQDVGAAPGGGSASWAAYSPSVDWVRDPGDSNTFWMPIDNTGPTDAGDSGDGWTTVDHLGTGVATLLVPVTPGAYVYGATFGYKIVHAGGPFDIYTDHGPAIIYKSGASYGVEIHADATPEFFAGYPADGGSHQTIARAMTGFAPLVDPTADGDEYGFACYVTISSSFTPGSSDIHRAGFAAMLWAHKVG